MSKEAHNDEECKECKPFCVFDETTKLTYFYTDYCAAYVPHGAVNYSAPPQCFCSNNSTDDPVACRQRLNCQIECKKRGIPTHRVLPAIFSPSILESRCSLTFAAHLTEVALAPSFGSIRHVLNLLRRFAFGSKSRHVFKKGERLKGDSGSRVSFLMHST